MDSYRLTEDIRWCGFTLFQQGEIVYLMEDRGKEKLICADPVKKTKQTVIQSYQLEPIGAVMEFKIIAEDNNKGQGFEHTFQVKPGVEMVAHFFGFGVFMRPEGCVLILPEGFRESIKNMTEDQDRIMCIDPDHPAREEHRQTLLQASLEWYPKDEVEPSNETD